MRKPGLVLALCAAAAPGIVLRAEDNCGRMVESLVRFRGKIAQVEQPGQRELVVTPIGYEDTRFVVSVSIEDADPEEALKRGATYNFGLHSPARTLGPNAVVGATLDFEAHVMHCDGVFRRFLDLQPRLSPRVQKFVGPLEVGGRYRAAVRWDPDGGPVLETRLRLPMHHGGGVQWLDSDVAPQLGPARPSATVTFDVVSRETHQRGERQWATTYTCAFVAPRR